MKGNNVTILSNSTNTVSNSNRFIGVTSFNKSGSFNYDHDIGVISVAMDSSSVTTNSYPPGFTQYTAAYRLKITVKNYGTLPVQQFYLNHYINPEICGKTYYHPWISSPLAPGGTVSITTPMFTNVIGVLPGPPSSQTFVVNNACVYTTLPNSKNDLDFTNDAACITVLIPFVTSIEQRSIVNSDVIISPNPFHDKISVSSRIEIQKVEVFDVTGQLLKSFELKDTSGKLLLEEVTSGIYFLKIYSLKGTVIKKAVKE